MASVQSKRENIRFIVFFVVSMLMLGVAEASFGLHGHGEAASRGKVNGQFVGVLDGEGAQHVVGGAVVGIGSVVADGGLVSLSGGEEVEGEVDGAAVPVGEAAHIPCIAEAA